MCTTMSGRAIYPTNLGIPTLGDIALSLSRMPRFAGHTRQPFTVLQHLRLCLLLAEPMLKEFNPRARALATAAILLHDAEESVLGDMPSTWKNANPEVKRLYERLNHRINYAYLGMEVPEWTQEIIGVVDTLSLQVEMLEFAAYECWEHSGQAWHSKREEFDDERHLAQTVAAEWPESLIPWFVSTIESQLAVLEEINGSQNRAAAEPHEGARPEGGVAAVVISLSGGDGAPSRSSQN